MRFILTPQHIVAAALALTFIALAAYIVWWMRERSPIREGWRRRHEGIWRGLDED